MPRTREVAIFVSTDKQTNKQTNGQNRLLYPACACARGNYVQEYIIVNNIERGESLYYHVTTLGRVHDLLQVRRIANCEIPHW